MVIAVLLLQSLAVLGEVVGDLDEEPADFCLDKSLVVLPIICIYSLECLNCRLLEFQHSVPGGVLDKLEVPVIGESVLVLGLDTRILQAVNARVHLVGDGETTFLLGHGFGVVVVAQDVVGARVILTSGSRDIWGWVGVDWRLDYGAAGVWDWVVGDWFSRTSYRLGLSCTRVWVGVRAWAGIAHDELAHIGVKILLLAQHYARICQQQVDMVLFLGFLWFLDLASLDTASVVLRGRVCGVGGAGRIRDRLDY